ncbi:MAG: mechanosensitive ion channel family protein [Candidatus Aminicenantes bacterium]|nr:MAG: mechanosensitive ion channel family protein [Candidatus Aminicenantes bacterium]
MDFINEAIQFISENVYLRFIAILVLTLVIAFILKIFLKVVLKPLVKKTTTKIDDIIVKSLSSLIFYVVLLVAIKVGLQHFELRTTVLQSIVDTLLVLIVTIFLLRIISHLSQLWMKEWKFKTKTSADERLIPFLQKILKAVVIILAVIFAFNAWSINISPLLATAGIAGLAIGLAVKDSLSNILGGLQLVLDRTFKVGDKVELESGEMGVILDIGLRSTKLKTYDNEVVYIPNGYLANAKIKNFTHPDVSIRVNVEFGIAYGSDTEKVRQVVLNAVKIIDTVIEEPEPVVQFLKMSDFSLDFIARAWVKEYTEAYSTKIKMTDEIYNALNRAGISIPFPTRTVYTKEVK